MDYKASWIDMLTRNQRVINAQSEGLSHADSLLQLPFRGNCFNWVLGHLVVYRGKMLALFDQEQDALLSEAQKAIYDRGSETLTDGKLAMDFHELLKVFNAAQGPLIDHINKADEQLWDEERQSENGTPYQVSDRLSLYLWHEAYHSGQTEYLRQLAGKNDRII